MASKILGVMADLFFQVKIIDAAKKAGVKVEFVKTEELAWEKINMLPPVVIFDLNDNSVDAIGLIKRMKSDEHTRSIPAIGFISHVQTGLKELARESGCDIVVARSAFAQNLAAMLEPYAPPADVNVRS
jgi:CheY-like chemotaxis protein